MNRAYDEWAERVEKDRITMSVTSKIYGYTVVQHSAAGYKNDPTFAAGLEVRTLRYKKDHTAVQLVGGKLFETYGKAEEYIMDEMYPDEKYDGLIPKAKGTFSHKKVDGLRIYIPADANEIQRA